MSSHGGMILQVFTLLSCAATFYGPRLASESCPGWLDDIQRIGATSNTTDLAPQKVVFWNGNGTPSFREIEVGER